MELFLRFFVAQFHPNRQLDDLIPGGFASAIEELVTAGAIDVRPLDDLLRDFAQRLADLGNEDVKGQDFQDVKGQDFQIGIQSR